MQERQHLSFVEATPASDGLVATYRPDSLNEIAPWILGWGTAAEVLAPPELRERLRLKAESVGAMLT
jgi:predicted DNA-binding transcriptional regulator YafY